MNRASTTTVAIIGHACRFPGNADSPEKFWSLLLAGTDAVTQVPPDRFDQRRYFHPDPSVRGHSYTFAAGTIGDVSGFDATFFGVSAREAEQMDPQQRLLLELTQEALERGGQIPSSLAGTDCAVFVGVSSSEYADRRINDLAQIDTHTMLGATFSILANRISYLFDLRGPSMAIDTACSSSLVALHEAVQTLQSGRSSMAIVGAVNLLLSPAPFVGFSKARMLARDGRCRAFAKGADGYVRAEGGGILILKPLKDAQRDGDPILALVRGVEINTDGRTAGMALPASDAQRELLQTVYTNAKIDPSDISYFEAHGTGTAVGDPVEASAIGEAIGRHRSNAHPLLIGSVKTNIGHLEAAAGMAGLIKAIEILRHDVIPPSLHSSELNPDINFDAYNIEVVQKPTPLPSVTGRKLVGVSSFGFGGTNAHAILEAYGSPSITSRAPSEIELPLTISARTEEALSQQVKAFAEKLRNLDPFDWYDFAYTAACRRTHHEYRMILHAKSAKHASKLLESAPLNQWSRSTTGRHAKTALVFTGNGAQWIGMGRTLWNEDPFFKDALNQFDARIRWRLGWSIVRSMQSCDALIEYASIAQPLLFALQVALVESLQARGLTFDGVIGHSVGEVAAAYVAGALSSEQAVRVIRERSEAQTATHDQGRMMVVGLSASDAKNEVSRLYGDIDIAAINSPRSTTLSGPTEAILAMENDLKDRGIATKVLDLRYAFHSSQQDQIRAPLLAALSGLQPKGTKSSFYSTVTGALLDGSELGPEYWWHNVRDTVRFADAVAAMEADGYRVFIEVGPHAQLQGNLRQILKQGRPVATLTRDQDGLSSVLRALDDAYLSGATIDFAKLFPTRGKVLDLPQYPWKRDRHWHQPTLEKMNGITSQVEGPLLGLRATSDASIWEHVLDAERLPYLRGHKIAGNFVFPAAGFIEIALEAAASLFGDSAIEIEGLEILKPLVLDVPRCVRTTMIEGGYFRIEAREYMRSSAWSTYATGRLSSIQTIPDVTIASPGENSIVCDADAHYAFAQSQGFEYRDEFRVLEKVRSDLDSAFAELRPLKVPYDYRIHVGQLDGVLQTVFPILQQRAKSASGSCHYLPHKIGRIFFQPGRSNALHASVTIRRTAGKSFLAAGVLCTAQDLPLIILEDIRLSPLNLGAEQKPAITLYDQVLEPLPALKPTAIPDLAVHAALTELRRPAANEQTRQLLDQQLGAFVAEALLQLGQAAPTNLSLLAKALEIAQNYASEDCTAEERWRQNLAQRPDLIAELNFIGRFGRSLLQQLTGGEEPSDFGSARQRLLEHGALSKAGCRRLAAAVECFMRHWPKERRLRILQVGAGSSGFSEDLWDLMPAGQADLVIVEPAMDRRQSLTRVFDGVSDVLVADQINRNAWSPFDLVIVAYNDLLDDIDGLLCPGALLIQAQIALSDWTHLAFPSKKADISHEWGSQHRTLYDGVELISAHFPSGSLPTVTVQPKQWTIIATAIEKSIADQLAAQLTSYGHRVVVEAFNAERRRYQRDNVVFLCGFLDSDGYDRQLGRCTTLLNLLQRNDINELVLLLQDALPGYTKTLPVAERAAIAGIARVLQNENPNIDCRTIDVRCHHGVPISQIAEEIALGSEKEVIVSNEGRFVLRLCEIAGSGKIAEAGTVALQTTGGTLDQLRWLPLVRSEVGSDDVEIAVAAAGLNFRDVMFAMGLLPSHILEGGFAGATLGMEASGTVTKVGSNVRNVTPGDKVMCFAPASLANRVVTRSEAVIPLPEGLDFAEGATLITALFTVTYALSRLARLSRGERLLVHGAAGAVGIAALQYARAAGADIFATAGSEDKRDFLKLMGVPDTQVLNSRSLEFANQIRDITNGEGVDVVLNSLAGEGVHRGLSLLKPFGRFIELGKIDFVSNSKVGLNYFRNNIAYFGVDADQVMSTAPQLAKSVLQEVQSLVAKGIFTPLPYCEFSWRRVNEAFRHMQRARHIGKVVIKTPSIQPESSAIASETKIRSDATYIVTGGLKGVGLARAQWLVDRGATHLVLVNRSGTPSDEAQISIDTMRSRGAIIDVRSCDVTDAAAVAALIDEFKFDLKGIIHAATAYADYTISNMSADSFEIAMGAKARGALLLDWATRDIALDLFVLYSSVSTVVGNPGQAGYVAANMVLESLAARRKVQGRAAQLVALPPISDNGHLADKPQLLDLFRKIGIQPFTSAEIFAQLDDIVLKGKKAFLLADINWSKLRATLPLVDSIRFTKVAPAAAMGECTSAGVDFEQIAASLPAHELQAILLDHMSEAVGHILHVAGDKLDRDCSVFDLGMDSLMGIELKMEIEKRFGVRLPMLGLLQDLSIRRAAEMVQNELQGIRDVVRSVPKITAEGEKSFILTKHGEQISVGVIADAIDDIHRGISERLIV